MAELPEGTLNASCMTPCHGFEGIVEQWKTSTHYAAFIANLGGDEVETWTGPRNCGNCHAIDAIEYRLAGDVLYNGTTPPEHVTEGQLSYLNNGNISESAYAGQASVAAVHCSTCHETSSENDPHLTGADYETGAFPLRVPTDTDTIAYIEKSSEVGVSDGTAIAPYGTGNACMWCHKSRKDVTNYAVDGVNLTSTHWGPHNGPHADIFSGLGGYHYEGETYNGSTHQSLEDGCVGCHMEPLDVNNGVGDHSFYPSLNTCLNCHDGATDFDINSGQSDVKATLRELRTLLNDLGWITRAETEPYDPLTDEELADDDFGLDHVRPGGGSDLTADEAGALYNYLIIARGSALGVHNPRYVQQLIFDSYSALDPEGDPPASQPTRP